MNETIKNLIERRSCRKYKSEQIKDEELNLILKAGEWKEILILSMERQQ